MKRSLSFFRNATTTLLLFMVTQAAWGTVAVNGKLPGAFSVSATKQVWFSQGNLQHSGANTTGTWSFAANQYDRYGTNQTDDHRDLFGWGTKTAPNNTSTNDGEYTWADWGENKISNGGNLEGVWSTLTADEWQYLFSRTNYRTMATVHSVPGLIMMPDDWTATTVNPTITVANYTTNILTDNQWTVLEEQGCVFLPTNGWRDGAIYSRTDEHAVYWTSTTETNTTARDAYIDGIGKHDIWTNENHLRHLGFCVRLVLQLWQGSGTAEDPYLINSAYDWNKLSYLVSNGHTFANTCFRQTADISVTTMVGTAIHADGGNQEEVFHTFNGTYDGYGHTITANLNVTGERYAGPFHCIADGATIKNLIVTGSVTVSGGARVEATRHPAGLVGTTRSGSCVIENCRVSANVSGADYMGGIIGHSWKANITMTGCVYNGTLTATGSNYTGGLIGWGGDNGGKTFVLSDNLFAGSYSGSGKFHPVGVLCSLSNNTRTVTNAYYTAGLVNMTNNDGNSLVSGLSYQGTFATPTSDKPANLGTPIAVYSVSGITAYTNGLCLAGQYFCGSPDFNYTLTTTAATILGESKYVTTFYHGTLAYQLPAGALAYTAGMDGDKVVFYRIGSDSNVIPADTAVIIVAEASAVSEGKLALTNLPSTDVTARDGNILLGSDTDIAKPSGTVCVLGVAKGVLGFYPFTGSTIPAGKAYYVEN